MSAQEHLLQMRIPETWDNNSYKGILIAYLREEEKRLSEGSDEESIIDKGAGDGKGTCISRWDVALENKNALMLPMKYDKSSDIVEFNDEPICLDPMLLTIQQEIETEDRRVQEIEEDWYQGESEDDY